MSEDLARRQDLLQSSGRVRRDMPLGKYMRLNWVLYIMLIPGLINLLLFKYLPMYGIGFVRCGGDFPAGRKP